MKNSITQITLNMRRLLFRDVKSFIASFIFPIFFYVLYTKFLTFEMDEAAMRDWQLDYLVSMSVYGMVFTSIQTVSSALIKDQTRQWDLFVRMSPQSYWLYYVYICLTYLPLHVLLFVLLSMIAYLLHQVTMPIMIWLGFLGLIVLSSSVFSLFGILVGMTRSHMIANISSNLLVFPMAILGGLWWPLYIMPEWLQNIGKILPTYQSSEIIRTLVLQKKDLQYSLIFGFIIWFITLFVVIIGLSRYQSRKEQVIL